MINSLLALLTSILVHFNFLSTVTESVQVVKIETPVYISTTTKLKEIELDKLEDRSEFYNQFSDSKHIITTITNSWNTKN